MRTAEEEAWPSTGGQQPATGVINAYMTLVDFCDQQLHKEEETSSGESQKKKISLSHCVSIKCYEFCIHFGFLFVCLF